MVLWDKTPYEYTHNTWYSALYPCFLNFNLNDNVFFHCRDQTFFASHMVTVERYSQVPGWTPRWVRGTPHCGFKLHEGRFRLLFVHMFQTAARQPFLEPLGVVLKRVPTGDSIVLQGDFNAHVGNDRVTWGAWLGGTASLIWIQAVFRVRTKRQREFDRFPKARHLVSRQRCF